MSNKNTCSELKSYQSSTPRKLYALEEACTIQEEILFDKKIYIYTSSTSPQPPPYITQKSHLGWTISQSCSVIAKLIAKKGKIIFQESLFNIQKLLGNNKTSKECQEEPEKFEQSKYWLVKHPVIKGVFRPLASSSMNERLSPLPELLTTKTSTPNTQRSSSRQPFEGPHKASWERNSN